MMIREPEPLEVDCTPRIFDRFPQYAPIRPPTSRTTAATMGSTNARPGAAPLDVAKPSPTPRSQEQAVQGNPILPPELEREILLYTVKTYRGTTVKLMLVAHRVHEWCVVLPSSPSQRLSLDAGVV
ncbi:hypothetical protein CONPUDRAFT_159790 [Coniophora puteana RWD-64-598 SS2]|uniref:Uncharacterized protein n=1 Tax=Coniophora puteana (strain RWD-64-598) TaxID=741705 RepID=A0A5M3M8R7_CONPW|nr:uncharacterized protein CONPUDRAFT_159790 [Coniophora puteana RWD-64-598 SS2]EIW75031.1 hypothetical protein CONPUDRAFT_159790 [Coniophora puteana RWD-64-598 SS2]